MKIFEDTLSFKLVTLLEEFTILKKYKNLILYLFYICRFHISTKRKIKKYSNRGQISLLFKLYKERFYLDRVLNKYNLSGAGDLKSSIINNMIISDIIYGDIKLNIEYNAIQNKYCMYFHSSVTNFNINEQNLIDRRKNSIFQILLKLIFEDVDLLLWKLFREVVEGGV